MIEREYNFIKQESSQPHLMQELEWATDNLYNNKTVGDVNSRARQSHPNFSDPVTKGWHSGLKISTMKDVNPEHWVSETQDLTIDILLYTPMISVGGFCDPSFT